MDWGLGHGAKGMGRGQGRQERQGGQGKIFSHSVLSPSSALSPPSPHLPTPYSLTPNLRNFKSRDFEPVCC
jgi:hypothetical protein